MLPVRATPLFGLGKPSLCPVYLHDFPTGFITRNLNTVDFKERGQNFQDPSIVIGGEMGIAGVNKTHRRVLLSS